MTEILQQKLKSCRLPGIQEHYESITEEAYEQEWSYEAYLEALLDSEIIKRDNHRFSRLVKQARFPTQKTLDQFDFSKAPYLKKSEITRLGTCQFIEDNTNLMFLGSPGTGKSHIATALGIEACKQGRHVSFYTAANLGNTLVEMQDEGQLTRFLDKLKKIDLLIIDELCIAIHNSSMKRSCIEYLECISKRKAKG